MSKVIFSINYGKDDIENIVDKIINEKISQITGRIKRGEIGRYNKSVNKNLSTNCKEKQEVLNK